MLSNRDVESEAPNNGKEKGKKTKKLVKKGFINYKIKKYSKDIHSNRVSTNKSRWDRLLFIAYQLARDVGVQLLIFGYFPNDMVGSCGSWSFGKITKLLKKKSDTRKYYNYWENFFSLIEAQRQNKEIIEVEKCHEAATSNVGASVNMDCDGSSDVENEFEDSDVENEFEDADVEKECEVEGLEEIETTSDEKNSMETLESVEFESVDQLQRWLNSANARDSSVTETELNPETSTVSFPPIPQNATVTAKTPPPPAVKVPHTPLSSVSVTLVDKATGTLSPTPLATKYPATPPLSTDSSSTPLVSLGATCVRCSAKVSETSPATKDPATTSPPTYSDSAPSVPLDVTYVTLTAKASKTPQATKDPAPTSLPTDSDPALSDPLDSKCVALAVKASKTQQATKDPTTTSPPTDSDRAPSVPLGVTFVTLAAKASKTPQSAKDQATTSPPTGSNPAPSVSAASAVISNQPPSSNAKKRTAIQILASAPLPSVSSPTPSVSARLIAKRKQPPRKKPKKTEVKPKQTSCNADVC